MFRTKIQHDWKKKKHNTKRYEWTKLEKEKKNRYYENKYSIYNKFWCKAIHLNKNRKHATTFR